MNERIKLLAEQAGAVYSNDHAVSLLDDEIEKFAEMIVQECCQFANNHNEEIEGVTLGVGQALKKHFGVEE